MITLHDELERPLIHVKKQAAESVEGPGRTEMVDGPSHHAFYAVALPQRRLDVTPVVQKNNCICILVVLKMSYKRLQPLLV